MADPFTTPPLVVDPRSSSEETEPFPPFIEGPEIVDITSTSSLFSPRPDRLAESITAENAQGVLDPHACVFVANLPSLRTDEELQQWCDRKFGKWGKCYPKIKRDKKGMPYALIQYHDVEHARLAIRDSKGMSMDGREIRAEHAKVDRIVLLTRHTGGGISDEEARGVLEHFGAIEETCPVPITDQKARDLPEGRWVKFAFFQDCVDARFAFRNHEFFKLLSERKVDSRNPRSRSDDNPFSPPNSAPAGDRNPYRAARNTPDDQCLFIGELPLDVTERQIRQVFGRYGEVVYVDIHRKPIKGTDRINIFAFLGYETARAADDALNAYPDLRGYPLRIERKAWQRRNLRMHNEPSTPTRQQNPVLAHLYHAGVRLGLPHDLARQILSIRPRQLPHNSIANDTQAYGNPAHGPQVYGDPATCPQAYGNAAYGNPAYGPQAYCNPAYGPQAYGNPAYGPQAYGNPAYGPQAYGNPAYGLQAYGNTSHGNAAYGPQAYGNTAYGNPAYCNPALSAPAQGGDSYRSSSATHPSSYYRPQLVQPSNVEYRPLPPPQMLEQSGPHASNAPTPSAPRQVVAGGTTYYSHPNQASQPTMQGQTGAHTQHFDHQGSASVTQAPETTDTGHRFSHESYLPETYAGEPYNPDSYDRGYAQHPRRRYQ